MSTPSGAPSVALDGMTVLYPLPPVPALDNTFGAVLLGTCFGLILYGLTAHQAYRYFRLYPTDVPVLKALVTVLVSLETLHTALCIHMWYVRQGLTEYSCGA
ncbi:hypothetical protein BV20DRAFT_1029923 [Pilatotrama ljubarskyi]|nr:hypothetical protein BV20DRAFT_1029923 [Pilatotrama ljubarskyi]